LIKELISFTKINFNLMKIIKAYEDDGWKYKKIVVNLQDLIVSFFYKKIK